MALFESYERRIDKINGVLAEYGISSVEECAEICKRQRPEMYEIAPGHYVRCHCLYKTAAYRGIIDAASVEEGAGKYGESTV